MSQIAQIKKIHASYLDGYLPIEDNVNQWLLENKIAPDKLIKVTTHYDKVYSGYPAPNDYKPSCYAIIYYIKEIIDNTISVG